MLLGSFFFVTFDPIFKVLCAYEHKLVLKPFLLPALFQFLIENLIKIIRYFIFFIFISMIKQSAFKFLNFGSQAKIAPSFVFDNTLYLMWWIEYGKMAICQPLRQN